MALSDELYSDDHQVRLVGALRRYARRFLPESIFYALLRTKDRHLRNQSAKDIFSDIYEGNRWRGEKSRSGTGSDPAQTATLKRRLKALLDELSITSLLDIPCGDFLWLKDIDLADIEYIGADIVPELIKRNQKYSSARRRFKCLDIINDPLPRADLILVRDCLVHFCDDDVSSALRNLVASGSTYLLATTFPDTTQNRRIHTGQWRPLNLEIDPFLLRQPLTIINEGLPNDDKSLGLWELSSIRQRF